MDRRIWRRRAERGDAHMERERRERDREVVFLRSFTRGSQLWMRIFL
jgi:hypothetical protein